MEKSLEPWSRQDSIFYLQVGCLYSNSNLDPRLTHLSFSAMGFGNFLSMCLSLPVSPHYIVFPNAVPWIHYSPVTFEPNVLLDCSCFFSTSSSQRVLGISVIDAKLVRHRLPIGPAIFVPNQSVNIPFPWICHSVVAIQSFNIPFPRKYQLCFSQFLCYPLVALSIINVYGFRPVDSCAFSLYSARLNDQNFQQNSRLHSMNLYIICIVYILCKLYSNTCKLNAFDSWPLS